MYFELKLSIEHRPENYGGGNQTRRAIGGVHIVSRVLPAEPSAAFFAVPSGLLCVFLSRLFPAHACSGSIRYKYQV